MMRRLFKRTEFSWHHQPRNPKRQMAWGWRCSQPLISPMASHWVDHSAELPSKPLSLPNIGRMDEREEKNATATDGLCGFGVSDSRISSIRRWIT